MIETHVHCDNCKEPIPKWIKVNGKRTINAIQVMPRLMAVMTPEGPAFQPVPQPVCDTCVEMIKKSQNSSKLIVPGKPRAL
jgi:hypothetical protein